MNNREQAVFEADQLTQQAIAAAQIGENIEAERLLQRAIELDEENVEAWLWLARVTDDLTQKQTYFEQVLALDPYNEPARLGLERLREKLGLAEVVEEEEITYCTWHPNVETRLRCNRCGRLMCPKCAVQHPVGLRCKECVRQTRTPLYSPALRDYLVAGMVGLALGTLAGLIMTFIGGFWLISLFLGPTIGAGIADVMFRTVRKRGKGMATLASACLVLGAMLAGVLLTRNLLGIMAILNFGTLIYLALGASGAFYRLR